MMPGSTAKRLRPTAQRCRFAATLGLDVERGRNPIGVEADRQLATQGSRGGNPGLEVETALR